jgi:hypothetical protein
MCWKLIMPFKGYYCWEMQFGPLVIQWNAQEDPLSQHPARRLIWCWIDK